MANRFDYSRLRFTCFCKRVRTAIQYTAMQAEIIVFLSKVKLVMPAFKFQSRVMPYVAEFVLATGIENFLMADQLPVPRQQQ